jgi:spore germination protein KC
VIGRRAYWAHSKIVIISGSIAEKDITPVLDWLYRDSELRRDVKILISAKEKAGEVLKTNSALEDTVSYHLYSMLEAQKGVYRYPDVELWEVIEHISTENKSMLIPEVEVEKEKNQKVATIKGSAILKNCKLIGTLSPEETYYALWLQGKVKGGVFVIKDYEKKNNFTTYEVYNVKRKVDISTEKGLSIKNNIKCVVGIAEIADNIDFREKRNELNDKTQKVLEERLTYVVKKVQNQYQSDIFDFGQKVRIQDKKHWKSIRNNWDEEFSNVPVEIKVDVKIRGSSTVSKPVKEDE